MVTGWPHLVANVPSCQTGVLVCLQTVLYFKCTRGSCLSIVNLFVKTKSSFIQPYDGRIRITKIAANYFWSTNYILGVVLSASHALSHSLLTATHEVGTTDPPILQ